MIQARGLTKRFGSTLAVDDLSFPVEPGKVTGLLGPNGAGKSTTLHLMLGLVRGGGRTLFEGRPYRELACPMRVVGAMLEARALHPRRSARNHLRMLAAAARVPDRRVDQVLDEVGLAPVAHRRAGGFSLGMAQRLGLAAALLAEPRALLLDEPANGLDPHGVAWLRQLLRAQAAHGRAVLVSSHLLAEMQLLADHLLVIGRGRLLADEPTDRLLHRSRRQVLVRSPDADRLAELLVGQGATVKRSGAGELTVSGLDTQTVGELAHQHRLRLYELASRNASLEAAFLELVDGQVDYLQAGAGRP
jgi:ABC-2 type transport system ATP-binding protein